LSEAKDLYEMGEIRRLARPAKMYAWAIRKNGTAAKRPCSRSRADLELDSQTVVFGDGGGSTTMASGRVGQPISTLDAHKNPFISRAPTPPE